MNNKDQNNFTKYIEPLNINGLRGRILKMPAPDGYKRDILMVYGHHSSLERMEGLAMLLNDFGSVTMADLPGFGGMDSFYSIGQKPTLDNLADYLASVIKLRYKKQKLSIVAISFGFLVVTKMLQKYPELTKKVDMLVSVVGFTHRSEFKFSKSRYLAYKITAKIFVRKLPAVFFRNIVLHPLMIRNFYSKTHNAKHKFKSLSSIDKQRATEFEIYLWRCNDVRTHMETSLLMLNADSTKVKVNIPVIHLSVKNDNYFDNHMVEQHMKIVFSKYTNLVIKMNNHAVSVIANKKDSAPLVPPKLRSMLAQKP